MSKRELPKHLKELARNLDKGLNINGNPLSNSAREGLGKMMGAGYYKSKEGKIKKVR